MTQVPNPYRAAVVSALSRDADTAAALGAALNGAVTAFEGGAWVGGSATSAAQTLGALQADLKSVAHAVTVRFYDEIRHEDLQVEVDSWQARWNKPGLR